MEIGANHSMNILFLMTARGGSKSVPRKNLSQVAGMSLIGFKAISARRSKYCTRLILSSDDAEIQQNALSYGVEVPFIRPAELATDTASSFDVIRHAMDWIEENTNEHYEAIMLLEPSAPFATWADFDNAVEMLIEKDANAVIGMREMEINSVFVGELDELGRMTQIIDQMQQRYLRRQDTRPEYTMNGALYLFKWDLFKEHHTMYVDRENTYGYIMDRYHSIEIDEPIDLAWAEFLVTKGFIDLSYWR
jgi:CMP-N,N'-diacetyllegionaminic acid synthase